MKAIEPPIFLQSRYTTCGIACLMMALKTLGEDICLTRGTEGQLFRTLRVRGYQLVPAISLATHAKKLGRTVGAVIEDGAVDFWTYWRNADPHMYEAQEEAYARARSAGVAIKHDHVTAAALKQSLGSGSLAIVGIDLGDGVKHALLLYGWKNGRFLLVDPLFGKRELTEKELLQQMQMEFGKWYIEIQ